jgi:hypothetical protein
MRNVKSAQKTKRLTGWFRAGVAIICFVAARAVAGIDSDLRFESCDFMKRTAYRRPEKLVTEVAPSGAYGKVNERWDQLRQGPWYIEEQRYGADAVCAGIAQGDSNAVERGLRVLRWGVEQQEVDGSFKCPDAFHSTSFFLEAAAHACLLLNASALAGRYADDVDWMRPRLLKAALWMTQPAVEKAGRAHNAPYTHRCYLVAAALGETGELCVNQFLVAKSKDYIREGISRQDPSGFNPEKGGYDSSYHAVGLILAERYYNIVANDATRHELLEVLRKGMMWLQSRVRMDGSIDPTGNTRTGFDQERNRAGEPKTMNYGQTYRAFYLWSLISGDQEFARLANLVFAAQQEYRRQLGHHG